MTERRCIILGLFLLFNLSILTWRILSYEDTFEKFPSSQLDNNEEIFQQLYAGKHLLSRGGDSLNESTLSGLEDFRIQFEKLAALYGITNEANVSGIPFVFSVNQRPSNDSKRLIDIFDFKFKIQQTSCTRHIQALIVVHTAPENYEKRKAIRETWGQKDIIRITPFRLLFLLGSVNDFDVQQKLEQENSIFADMVQGSFMDTYYNMTYKHVMAFKWFLYNCRHAQILIKVDDDIFLNTPRLLKLARESQFQKINLFKFSQNGTNELLPNITLSLFKQQRKLLFCSKQTNALVKRTYRSKWRVSFREYPHRYYPPYCPGYAIIYSMDVVERLYNSAQRYKFFWIDDVLITGILAQLNKIDITDALNFVLTDKKLANLLLKSEIQTINSTDFLFSTHSIGLKKMYALWKLLSTQLPSSDKSNFISEENTNPIDKTHFVGVSKANRKIFNTLPVNPVNFYNTEKNR